MINKKLLSPIKNVLFFNTVIKISGITKISFIVGSQLAFFSSVAIAMPLSGAFAGIFGCIGVFGTGFLARLLLFRSLPVHFLAYHIPGLFASLQWALQSKILRIAPSLVCMVLFIMHPIGASAALYSLFWIIPTYLILFCKDTVLSRSVASTFTAHAVGSIIWLFTVPMTCDQWLFLIPAVIVERVLISVAMALCYQVVHYILRESIHKKAWTYGCAITHSWCMNNKLTVR